MLHAILYHKLNEDMPEAERLEDALTSSAFGIPVLVGRWDLLLRWLDSASAEGHELASGCEVDVWFWPRLAYAEPDVLLRIGDVLFVVEAKYRSGRHDGAGGSPEQEDESDQIVRQHSSIRLPPAERMIYPESIERAIAECRVVQVFVVDGRRMRRATREFQQSRTRLPHGADLRLVTWQALYRLVHELQVDGKRPRWAADLLAYLELTGLDAFVGFRRSADAQPASMRRLVCWNAGRGGGLRSAVANAERVRTVCQWRGGVQASHGLRSFRFLTRDLAEKAGQVLCWRAAQGGRSARTGAKGRTVRTSMCGVQELGSDVLRERIQRFGRQTGGRS